MKRLILGSILWFLGAAAAWSQSVHWEPARGTLAVGQANALTLVYDGCEPKGNGQPTLPKVDGLSLQFYQRSDSTSMVNFSFTRTVSLTYAAMLSRKQSVDIPEFEVDTDKGRMRVAAAHFDPTGATVGNGGAPLETAANAKLIVTPASVYAGEVFEIETSVEAAKSYFPRFQASFDFKPDPLLIENWGSPERLDTQGGDPHSGVRFRTRALARTPGPVRLNPASHLVNLSVGLSGFGFFQQRQYDQYSVASNTPLLTVKALPIPPAGFTGAVGQFKLTSRVVPLRAAVGEPVTWTLELAGAGNWPDINGLPAREVSRDFNVVQPKAKKTPLEGRLFDATLAEDVVLVPTKAGTYSLGALEFSYFDPKSGTYKKLTAPPASLVITEPVASQFAAPAQPALTTPTAPPGGPAPVAAVPRTIAPVPTLPSGLPRDLLAPAGEAPRPWTGKWTAIAFCSALGVVLAGWVAFAWSRARQTDPARPRRAAGQRLRATLEKIAAAGPAARGPALLDWQHDAGILWQLQHAAPAAEIFPDAGWSRLWAEADRALYGPDATLPPDWVARGRAALGGKRVPPFSPFQLFLPRNLAPFLFGLVLLLGLAAATGRAEDAAAAYRAGNFADAEKAWTGAVQAAPTDPSARYNLSLALAQQDRWDFAAAQATAAFVQRPAEAAIRWQFALACEKAGFTPAPLAGFLRDEPWPRFVARASAATWQRTAVAALALAAAGGLLLLAAAYRFRPRLCRPAGLALAALGLLATGLAVAAESTYGDSRRPDAVLVAHAGILRSIPTEADTTQKTTPVAAGTIGHISGDYLTWVQLAFANGQTGWLRRSEVVGLWQ